MQPLSGVRVLDLGVVLAGPQAALMLADLGAEVIRVESTQHFAPLTRGLVARPSKSLVDALPPLMGGYPDREPGARPWNRFPWFNALARNKLSMTVDLRRSAGLEIFRRLVCISDCLLINQRAGTLQSMGVTAEELLQLNPRLVYVDASGYGASGPYASYRAFGSQIDAFSGNDARRNYHDAREGAPEGWTVLPDAAAAMAMALAACLALIGRNSTGKGQYIDISMAESSLSMVGDCWLNYALNRREPERLGNRDVRALQGCYPCAGEDRWIVVTIPEDSAWQALSRALGDPEWMYSSALTSAADRYRQHDRIDAHLIEWTRARSRVDALSKLRAAGVLAAPVLDDADLFLDPQLRERGFFLDIEQADAGRHDYPGPPFKLRRSRFVLRQAPVRLGEHNEYVYQELLGYSAAEYRRFEQEGHIGTEYAGHIA